MAWPKVRDLLPDQKLIVYHLWATSPSAAGCYLLDFAAFSAALSVTIPAMEEAMRDFERRRLLAMDQETGEVFLLDWYRFHKFDSLPRRKLLEDAVKKIQSIHLKTMIIEKSTSCLPREGKERKVNNTPPTPPRGEGKDPPPGGSGGGGLQEEEELQHALEYKAKRSGKTEPAAWAASAIRRVRKEGIGSAEKEVLQTWRRHVASQKKEEEQKMETASQKNGPPANWKDQLPEKIRAALES